MNNLVLCA